MLLRHDAEVIEIVSKRGCQLVSSSPVQLHVAAANVPPGCGVSTPAPSAATPVHEAAAPVAAHGGLESGVE